VTPEETKQAEAGEKDLAERPDLTQTVLGAADGCRVLQGEGRGGGLRRVILTPEQAYCYVFGSEAEAIGVAVARELGLAYTSSPGAAALADWALDRPDTDPALEAFSGLLDTLAWGAVVTLHDYERRAA